MAKFNPMTGKFEEEQSFGPTDLLMPQAAAELETEEDPERVDYDSLDTLEDIGYVPPTQEQMASPGFQKAQAYMKNSSPIVGQKAAELLGAYKEQQPERQPAAEVPEISAPEQSSTQDTVSLLEKYKQLTKNKNENNRNADLLQGGNQIAQAIASGFGGKIGDGSEAVNALRKSNNQPIEDLLGQGKVLEQENEMQMSDPNSDISKFARERALAQATKMGMSPDSVKKLESMSAKQLEKLGLFKAETANRNGLLRFEKITGPDGITRTVAINNQTGEIVNTVGQTGFASQFRTDPQTGNIIALTPSNPNTNPVGVTGGSVNTTEKTVAPAKGATAEQPKVDYTSPTSLNKINPNLYKEFKKTQDEFTKDMKESREVATGATLLSAKLTPGANGDIDSGLLGGIQTQAAKMSGQKGVLTDQDLVKFAGAGGVSAAISRIADGSIFGNMSEQDLKFFKAFAKKMQEATAEDIQNRSQVYKQQVYNEAKDYLPGLAEQDVEKWLQVQEIAPAVQNKKTGKTENKQVSGKKIVRKQQNSKLNKTRLTYDDGTTEEVDGLK